MFFELLSSAVVGGLVGYSSLAVNGMTNDGRKIARICSNAGLSVKEQGKAQTMQLLRKSKRDWGMEYAYRIPLGLSFSDFQRRVENIEDGLNGKSYVDVKSFLQAFKTLKLGPNILRDIKGLLTEKKAARKEVELSYNGLLIVKVYDTPMTDKFDYDRGMLDKLKGWEIPAGTTRTQIIKHDFEKHCHLIVAGMTDYGKSVFLKNIITTLVAKQTKNVKFFLIDLKGGLAFNRFRSLEQVQGIAKKPDEALEMLTLAQAKMEERIDYLLRNDFEDIKEAGFPDRYFVVIDEAADISDDKACQAIIKDIARRGRGAGFRLIYATQYPTNETLSPQVRQNCSARICFRLGTGVASRAVLDEEGAEKLPLIKGRAIYKTDRTTIVQTPLIENEFINETIKPNIIIRARKDDDKHDASLIKGTTQRKHSLVIEEVGIC
ncbi:cell division protein FtsK [Peribacillus saganii]|uniref:Cell division protein FtsK n=2 Tax=Peribacillus saganii TaxID=2303992 RepID=A0A372LT83_9BACI|nr:cell division protein FtsK [Peribacillus saganii]